MYRFYTLLSLGVALLMTVTAASANTITVTTLIDERNADGDCSLREAVEAANQNVAVDDCSAGEEGLDEIVFNVTEAGGSVILGLGVISVTDSLSINGLRLPSDQMGIDGRLDSRIFEVTGATLTLSTITLRNGRAVRGGAVYVGPDAGLMVEDALFEFNQATGDAATDGGAAIYNDGGSVDVTNSSFNTNDASGMSGSGGAVFNNDGNLMVASSTFSGNMANRAGGAIEALNGTTTLANTDFTSNEAGSAPGNGGAFHISGSGNATVRGGMVSMNTATAEGGGFWNNIGTMMISQTTFSGNTAEGDDADNGGGALYNNGGRMELDSTTVTGNTATGTSGSGGGILNNGGNLIVMSSTVSDNDAPRAGGGLEDASGTSVLIMSTFTGNDVTGNAMPGNGGAVHTGGGTIVVAGGLFDSNRAVEGGGLWTSGTLVITSSEADIPNSMMPGTVMPTITTAMITNNTATGNDADQGGGGLYAVPSGSILVLDAEITGNVANGTSGSGGGVFSAGSVTLRNATVSGNTANRAGGGIEDARGTVVLEDVVLSDNSIGIAAPGNGGGLHSGGGDVTITGGIVSGNTAVEGGGLWTNGTMTINGGAGDLEGDSAPDSDEDAAIGGDRSMFITITGNVASGDAAGIGGGGIFVESGGEASIRFAVIDDNFATGTSGSGGGLMVADGASARVSFSEITGNSANRAGGGIELFDDGTTDAETSVALRNVTLDGNEIDTAMPGNGGGIHAGGAGAVTLRQTTVSNNNAREGGGIWISGSGSADIGNSTVVRNTATEFGGGVYDNGGASISISSSTVAFNAAGGNGGGLVSQGAAFSFQNTIVASNTASGQGADCFGTFQSGDYNLIQTPGGCTISGKTSYNVNGTNPMLADLADNGGFTQTLAPMVGSAAINAGQSTYDFDQRGLQRNNGQDDIGAVEFNGTPVAGEDTALEGAVALLPARPNPVMDRATISFTVLEAGAASVEVYNVLGQRVLTAFQGDAAPGSALEADLDVSSLAAGVYLVRLESAGQTAVQQITVVR